MAVKIIRDSSLRLKLHPTLKARLEVLSDLIGVPPSTLGAMWIGQAITNQERSFSMVTKMAETLGSEAGEIMRQQLPELFKIVNAEMDVKTCAAEQ